ncbi:HK97 gp10 family phage protein [Gracilibacillus sp. HCP3S3_G5_1]|uniref:HK97 gp10 family phage protein n=1 Tax=unclassified Gracilibacillus TaxID=2625209 RepID=UPI003F8ADD8F
MDDIAKQIADALKEFTSEVEEGMEDAKKEVSKDTVKNLRKDSPEKTSEYAKGWKAKKTKTGYVVHNAKKPQLTHLLENGHAKRNGGRVSGQSHIYPNEQNAIKEFERLVEKVIKG